MKNRLFFIVMIIFIALLIFSLVGAESYRLSSTQWTQPHTSGLFSLGTQVAKETCEAGQDFIIQIAPFGCTPTVVRSDLLEEQDVPVFCQLAATKMNPMIDVKAIKDITFPNQPDSVRGIGFEPAKGALGVEGDINSPILSNIGYAVIVLKQQKNESALENCEKSNFGGGDVCWVEGNATAKLEYNIKNAFGFGDVNYYLNELSDKEWELNKNKYSFWKGKGYLRVDNIEDTGARVFVYSGDNKIASKDLKRGEESDKMYLPGFDCLAGISVKLNKIENPNTRAKLNANGDLIELVEGDSFLDGACEVKKVNVIGTIQKVGINCDTDKGGDNIDLMISPRVRLDIDGFTKDYNVGDFLYSYEDSNGIQYAYLGFAGTFGQSTSQDDLYVYIVSMPEYKEVLDDNELQGVYTIAKAESWDPAKGKGNILNSAENVVGFAYGYFKNFYDWMVEGKGYTRIKYLDTDNHGGKNIKLLGFSEAQDVQLTGESKIYYNNALADFNSIIHGYASTKYDLDISKGELAYYEIIKLADYLQQKRTLVDFCSQFKEGYPNSNWDELDSHCNNDLKLSNSGVVSEHVQIGGQVKEITLEGVYEPSFDEFGATILIKDNKGQINPVNLRKNEIFYLKDSEGKFSLDSFIQLVDLGGDSTTATIKVSLSQKFFMQNLQNLFTGGNKVLTKNIPQNFSSDYTFTLTQVNLKKVAMVSLIGNIDRQYTEANLSFKIGVEKRAIQLAPDQIRDKIKSLNKTISQWESINSKLAASVKALKTSCIATQGWLTLKNFVQNAGGKAIARQKVMRDNEGWYVKCTNLIKEGTYKTVEECLSKNGDKIEQDVNTMYETIEKQQEDIKNLQANYEESGILGTREVNDVEFKKAYANSMKEETRSCLNKEYPSGKAKIQNDEIDINAFVDQYLGSETTSIEDLRDLQLYCRLGSQSLNNDMSLARLNVSVKNIYENGNDLIKLKSLEQAAEQQGLKGVSFRFGRTKNTVEEYYDGYTATASLGSIKENDPIQGYVYEGDNYYLKLENLQGTNEYKVVAVYDLKGTDITDTNKFEESVWKNLVFKKYNKGDYNNPYKSSLGESVPVARYYETTPYKGMPAVVPFDLEHGWYAYVTQSASILGNIKSYDESGRVNSFFLCNVGLNGIEESMKNDDVCTSFTNGQTYDQFYGLTKEQTVELVNKAINAISQASKQYTSGVSKIEISGVDRPIKVGSPAVSIPDIQCQDIYSVADCKLLFNVCDPVICPSSRCDLGGKYPVSDVIQTGIIGGIVLCAPNFVGVGGDVYIPVCLSGINAGVEAWVQVLKAYQGCLQTNLDTGETIGICDYKNSIYTCEFFWRQVLPFAKTIIPKLIELVSGQSVRGGGEYLGVQSAWSNAEKSINYFTQYYGANAYQAFKSRSTEQVGTEVCKGYVSIVGPSGGDILDKLTEPDSPSQFYGRFEEIPFTTVTNPPISQYKVFYFIYAGKDKGAYYKVYLEGSPGSSFYQDTQSPVYVASGYIPSGESVDNTWDRTAPSGYQKLCIVVNDQTNCDFKEVTTDFGVNYIKDEYAAEQASTKSIKTLKECISGSMSLYSLLDPNIQEGIAGVLSPEIYNNGLVRKCATDNPGKGTDPNAGMDGSRWIDVGYCDDTSMRCWLDTDSVREVIKNLGIEKDVLGNLNDAYQKALASGTGFMDEAAFRAKLDEIGDPGASTSIDDSKKTLSLINDVMDKVFWNYHKGHLLWLREKVYSKLAQFVFDRDFVRELKEDPFEPIIKVGGIFRFKLNNIIYTLKVNEIKDTGVGFSITSEATSEPKNFVLSSGNNITWENLFNVKVLTMDSNLQEAKFRIVSLIKPTVGKIPETEIVFEYDGLYYKYTSIQGWLWSDDKTHWISTYINTDAEIRSYAEEHKLDMGTTSDKNRELIRALSTKTSYSDGLNLLVETTLNAEGTKILGITISHPDLITNEVTMGYNGIFILNSLSSVKSISTHYESLYFDDVGNTWKGNAFNILKDGWDKVSPTLTNTISSNLELSITDMLNQLNNINNFNKGAEVIFNLNFASYSQTIARKQQVVDEAAWAEISPDTQNTILEMEKGLGRNLECQDCNGFKFCTEEECKAIAAKAGLICIYTKSSNLLFDLFFPEDGVCNKKEGQKSFTEIDTIVNQAISKGILSSSCRNYVSYAVTASNKYNILDPLLLMAIMQQESSCNSEAFSGSSAGLMQINLDTWCGDPKYGLARNQQQCKQYLTEDIQGNINIGAQILRGYYNQYANNDATYNKKVDTSCDIPEYNKKYKTYIEWRRALRAYNGFGCKQGADVDYVEKVFDLYNKLSSYFS